MDRTHSRRVYRTHVKLLHSVHYSASNRTLLLVAASGEENALPWKPRSHLQDFSPAAPPITEDKDGGEVLYHVNTNLLGGLEDTWNPSDPLPVASSDGIRKALSWLIIAVICSWFIQLIIISCLSQFDQQIVKCYYRHCEVIEI